MKKLAVKRITPIAFLIYFVFTLLLAANDRASVEMTGDFLWLQTIGRKDSCHPILLCCVANVEDYDQSNRSLLKYL